MTYIDYLNDFNQWLETNALPASSQLMFYKLLYVFNRAGWPEYVGVDNLRLMLMTDTKSEKTVIRARDKLVEAGFITYKKGRKGTPNQYALCKKHCNNYSISDSVSASISDSHIKTKTKTKTNKDDDDRAHARDEGLGRVMSAYMNHIDPLPTQTSIDLLKGYVQTLGEEVCLRAIDRAIDAGARKWTYICKILQNCEKDGIHSVADWNRKEMERRGHGRTAGRDAAQSGGEGKKWNLEATEL